MNTPETPTRHPQPQPQNDAPKPNLATLVDNLKAIENRDEDTLQVLMANWQQIVGTVVVALAFIWIYQRYQASQTVKLGEASARFADAQTSFGAIVNPAVAINPAIIQATPPAVDSAKPQELAAPNLEVDKARASFEENLKSLQAAHGSTTYARLSELYQAKSALAQGDLELARKILTPIAGGAFEKFETRKKLLANDPDLVAKELATLMLARLRLGNEAERAQARETLKNLALGGKVVSVEAALAFSRSARSGEDRVAADKFITELKASRPELSEILSRETNVAAAAQIMPNSEISLPVAE